MKNNYMMTAEDVAEQLGISKGHAYKIVKQLNQELATSGSIVVAGKIPRAFWEKKFYKLSNRTENGLGRGEKDMPAYKDEERNTWTSSFHYKDWMGKQQRKMKRGFKTKREAVEFEANFKLTANANMDMKLGAFVEVYFNNKTIPIKR